MDNKVKCEECGEFVPLNEIVVVTVNGKSCRLCRKCAKEW